MKRLLASSLFLFVPGIALGATLTVTTTVDELSNNGTCSLREAVESANQDGDGFGCVAQNLPYGDDTIILGPATYTLSIDDGGDDNANLSGDIDVGWDGPAGNLIIQGAGVDSTIIDPNFIDRAFDLQDEAPNMTFELHDLTIRNGRTSGIHGGQVKGGAIDASDLQTVIVEDCAFINNAAVPPDGGSPGGNGGAIRAKGNLTVTRCLFEGNTVGSNEASNNADGGAIASPRGNVTVTDSVFRNNRTLYDTSSGSSPTGGSGGAIRMGSSDENQEDVLTVTGSLFENNQAGGDGGAIRIGSHVSLAVDSSSFVNNSSGNNGGAIRIGGSATCCDRPAATVSIVNSTFSGNEAAGLNWDDSTNSIGGGAIRVGGSDRVVTLSNVTINDNTITGDTIGGGIRLGGNDNDVTLRNTIVSLNSGGDDCEKNMAEPPVGSDFIEEGVSLDSDGSCGVQITANPQLSSLVGSELPAHFPLAESPAVDAGDNGTCEPDDQLGASRPQDGNEDSVAVCNIGAIESVLGAAAIPVLGLFGLLALGFLLSLVGMRRASERRAT